MLTTTGNHAKLTTTTTTNKQTKSAGERGRGNLIARSRKNATSNGFGNALELLRAQHPQHCIHFCAAARAYEGAMSIPINIIIRPLLSRVQYRCSLTNFSRISQEVLATHSYTPHHTAAQHISTERKCALLRCQGCTAMAALCSNCSKLHHRASDQTRPFGPRS